MSWKISPSNNELTDVDVGASSTDQSLQQSSCSTCQVQKDTSAYWTPELYYEHPDGTFESVPNEGMTVYYVGKQNVLACRPQLTS